MALTAPSAVLTGSTIASSFDQLLFVDAAAGMTEATLKIVSTEVGKSALSISDEHVLIKGVDTNNAAGFAVQQTDGTAILTVAADTPAVTLVGDLTVTGNSTFTTADNTDTLTLISTDADASSGPNLRLYRNSSSPADSDLFGQIDFEGRNDNSQDFVATQIKVNSGDVSDGTEDAQIEFDVMTAGTLREYMRLASGSAPSVVFNQDSRDIDFRVLSDNLDPALFVQGSDGNVGIGTAAPGAPLDIQKTIAGGDGNVPMLEITQLESENMQIGDGSSILFNTAITAGSSEAGASIAALRTSGADSNSSTLLEFRISQADANLDLAMEITEDGVVRKPLQPAFLARPSSQQTNMGVDTTNPIDFASQVFDQGADFDHTSATVNSQTVIGHFIAPVTGKYQLSFQLRLENIDSAAAYYQAQIITSNRTYDGFVIDPDFGQDNAYYPMGGSVLADMDTGDFAYVTLHQGGGSSQTDNADNSYFSGFLAC